MTTLQLPGKVARMGASRNYHLDQYAAWMQSWSAAPKTVEHRIAAAERAAHRWPDPRLVSTGDLSDWLASEDFAPWTRCTYYQHMRSLFQWLATEGHIDRDPTIALRRPTRPREKPRPLTMVEQQRILEESSGRLHCWLLLGLYAGLRAHETAKIRGEDVTQEVIFVRGKGGSDEMIPTHPVLWAAAEMWPTSGFWFPGIGGRPHVSSTTVTNATTRHFKRLGVEESYHRCRHSYGTNLLRSGVSLRIVQDLMRHRSLATTAAYLGVDADEKAEAIRRLAA